MSVNMISDDQRGSLSSLQVLALFAVAFLPFTQLRFGAIGIGEIILALVSSIILLRGGLKPTFEGALPIRWFFLLFMPILVLSLFVNKVLLGKEIVIWFAAFNAVSYAFVGVVLICLTSRSISTAARYQEFWIRVVYLWMILFSILFAISAVLPTFFGFSLVWHGRFAPLVDNLHQASQLTLGLTFIALHFALVADKVSYRLFWVGECILLAAMAWLSGASTVRLGFGLGVIAFAVAIALRGSPSQVKGRIGVTALAGAVLLFILSFNSDSFLTDFLSWIRESDGGGARSEIYSYAIESSIRSPILGNGPGFSVMFQDTAFDTHSGVLSVMLQTGLVGVAILGMLFVGLLKRAFLHPALFGGVVACLTYFTTGEALRRLPLWILLMAIMALSDARSPSSRRFQRMNQQGGGGNAYAITR